MKVYAILAEGDLFPNYYNTYKKAVDAFPNWEDGTVNDHQLNVIEVKE
jgi:hypothetical protein